VTVRKAAALAFGERISGTRLDDLWLRSAHPVIVIVTRCRTSWSPGICGTTRHFAMKT